MSARPVVHGQRFAQRRIAELQADYVVAWLARMQRNGIAAVEPEPSAAERFKQELRDALSGTVWSSGCESWYLNPDGTPNLWPWSFSRFQMHARASQP